MRRRASGTDHYEMSKNREWLEGQIGAFIRQYARKHYPNIDPNDRTYDREIEARVRRMDPQELDELLNGGADDPETDPSER